MGQYQTLKYQTDPTRNSVFFSAALNRKSRTCGGGQAFAKAQDPRDRQHPGDLRADHGRRRRVLRGSERLRDGRAGVQERERQVDLGAQARRPPQVGLAGAAVAAIADDPRRIRSSRARLPTQGRGEVLLLLGPCALYLAAFSIFPLVTSLLRSFQDYNTRTDTWRWVGLDNYSQLIHSTEFWTVVENTRAPDRGRRDDPGRARHGARALLQPAAPGRVDRARDPDPADAADADRRRADVAGAAQPRTGASSTGSSSSSASATSAGCPTRAWPSGRSSSSTRGSGRRSCS